MVLKMLMVWLVLAVAAVRGTDDTVSGPFLIFFIGKFVRQWQYNPQHNTHAKRKEPVHGQPIAILDRIVVDVFVGKGAHQRIYLSIYLSSIFLK